MNRKLFAKIVLGIVALFAAPWVFMVTMLLGLNPLFDLVLGAAGVWAVVELSRRD